jgi:hypothetical protein
LGLARRCWDPALGEGVADGTLLVLTQGVNE